MSGEHQRVSQLQNSSFDRVSLCLLPQNRLIGPSICPLDHGV